MQSRCLSPSTYTCILSGCLHVDVRAHVGRGDCAYGASDDSVAQDQTTIFVRKGFYHWELPIEVRVRDFPIEVRVRDLLFEKKNTVPLLNYIFVHVAAERCDPCKQCESTDPSLVVQHRRQCMLATSKMHKRLCATYVQVRRRIDVVGEPGTVLQGMWVMDDASGGGAFKGATIRASSLVVSSLMKMRGRFPTAVHVCVCVCVCVNVPLQVCDAHALPAEQWSPNRCSCIYWHACDRQISNVLSA
jgi:hypothetical protein